MMKIETNQETCNVKNLNDVNEYELDDNITVFATKTDGIMEYGILNKTIGKNEYFFKDPKNPRAYWGSSIAKTAKDSIRQIATYHKDTEYSLYMFKDVGEFAQWLVTQTRASH